MRIRFACICGKSYSVRDELAGRKTKCTACGAALTLPIPDDVVDAVEVVEEVPANAGFEVVEETSEVPANAGFEVVEDDEVTLTPAAPAPAQHGLIIWTNPDTTEQNIVMLSDDTIWTSRLPERALRQAQAKLQAGHAPATVLGQRVNRIPLDRIKRVVADHHSSAVDIDYSSPITTVTISFDSLESRNEFFDELSGRLPKRWTLSERKPKIWPRLSQPLAAIGLMLVIGLFLIPAAATAQETRSNPETGQRSVRVEGILFLLRGLGPVGVGVIVFLCLVGFGAWLAYEISRIPPKRLVLAPRE